MSKLTERELKLIEKYRPCFGDHIQEPEEAIAVGERYVYGQLDMLKKLSEEGHLLTDHPDLRTYSASSFQEWTIELLAYMGTERFIKVSITDLLESYVAHLNSMRINPDG